LVRGYGLSISPKKSKCVVISKEPIYTTNDKKLIINDTPRRTVRPYFRQKRRLKGDEFVPVFVQWWIVGHVIITTLLTKSALMNGTAGKWLLFQPYFMETKFLDTTIFVICAYANRALISIDRYVYTRYS